MTYSHVCIDSWEETSVSVVAAGGVTAQKYVSLYLNQIQEHALYRR